MGSVSSTSTERSEQRWFRAAAHGDSTELRRLATAEPQLLDRCDSRRMTAVMEAAARGHEVCLELLVSLGAQVDMFDSRGWTAAMHAAYRGQHQCLHILIDHGVDLDAQDFLGTTAAMRAAIGGHETCLRLLASHGANLLKKDRLGFKALTHADRLGHRPCTELLKAEDVEDNPFKEMYDMSQPPSLLTSKGPHRARAKTMPGLKRA
eukprot:TRINITY_DN49305_c0_g1_i1.p1 TRINITY_DN49305_c0_g1~~TRINITY_DN49305_c0_g1_i1.p1  ORF type:complete len:207 (+),score=36.24 TRINITY_DN49305_c0_g1_i1:73-693(+)